MDRLENKVALISGGARGMGAEFARAIVAEGGSVVIGDLREDEGRTTAAEIGDRARFVRLDVTDDKSWSEAVAFAVAEFGQLDVLVNNAGILNASPIDEYPIADWKAIVDVNLNGVFLGIRAAVPELKKSKNSPSIINMSSTGGYIAYTTMSGYVATKFAVRGLTKAAALELASSGIRVNSVHPGVIETPMTAGFDLPQTHVAMKRAGKPHELAKLIVFLASNESSFSTGAEFIADGGELAGMAI